MRAIPAGKTLRIAWTDCGEEAELAAALDELRQALAAERLHNAGPIADAIIPSTRMTVHG